MENIEFLKKFELCEISESEQSKEVKEIFKGSRRHLVEITLRNNEILKRHKAAEPITVLCLAGKGTFRAGKDLKDELELETGTLITLEAEVEHEVAAAPELHLLVTKFKLE